MVPFLEAAVVSEVYRSPLCMCRRIDCTTVDYSTQRDDPNWITHPKRGSERRMAGSMEPLTAVETGWHGLCRKGCTACRQWSRPYLLPGR